MTTKSIRIAGWILPGVVWLFITALRTYLSPYAPAIVDAALELTVVTASGALFAGWIASRLEHHDRDAEQRAQQLESLRVAAISLTTEVHLDQVLQRVVELSRELCSANYAALGMLDAEGARIAQFYTAGITAEQRTAMGEPPQGHGLLGAILTERRPMRVVAIQADPRSVGFPPNHPSMTTLLGVPIMSK
ncbi:MAG: GAF domain-containing protein, partial [Caldilineaceae bacterium]